MKLISGALLAVLLGASLPAVLAPAEATAVAAPCSTGHVALTFDSGPTPDVSPGLLDLLRRDRVKATFFVLGSRVKNFPDLARRMAEEGHVVGNHTWSHPDLTTLTDEQVREQVGSTERELVAAGVKSSRLVRPPSGRINAGVTAVLTAMGLTPVNWTVSSYDWLDITPEQIVNHVLRGIRPFWTNNVLMHDGNEHSGRVSLQTVPRIIAGARAAGYCFTTLGPRGLPVFAVPEVRATAAAARERRRVPARVLITLDRPTSRSVPVRVSTTNGSAVAGRDFRSVNRVVWLRAGARSAVVDVPVINDRKRERAEWFTVRLRGDNRSLLSTTEVRTWVNSNDR